MLWRVKNQDDTLKVLLCKCVIIAPSCRISFTEMSLSNRLIYDPDCVYVICFWTCNACREKLRMLLVRFCCGLYLKRKIPFVYRQRKLYCHSSAVFIQPSEEEFFCVAQWAEGTAKNRQKSIRSGY